MTTVGVAEEERGYEPLTELLRTAVRPAVMVFQPNFFGTLAVFVTDPTIDVVSAP